MVVGVVNSQPQVILSRKFEPSAWNYPVTKLLDSIQYKVGRVIEQAFDSVPSDRSYWCDNDMYLTVWGVHCHRGDYTPGCKTSVQLRATAIEGAVGWRRKN